MFLTRWVLTLFHVGDGHRFPNAWMVEATDLRKREGRSRRTISSTRKRHADLPLTILARRSIVVDIL